MRRILNSGLRTALLSASLCLAWTVSAANTASPDLVFADVLGEIGGSIDISPNKIAASNVTNGGLSLRGVNGEAFRSEFFTFDLDADLSDDGSSIGGNIVFGNSGTAIVSPFSAVDSLGRGLFTVAGKLTDFRFSTSQYAFIFRVTNCGFHPDVAFPCRKNHIWGSVFSASNLPVDFGSGASQQSVTGQLRIGVIGSAPLPASGLLLFPVALLMFAPKLFGRLRQNSSFRGGVSAAASPS